MLSCPVNTAYKYDYQHTNDCTLYSVNIFYQPRHLVPLLIPPINHQSLPPSLIQDKDGLRRAAHAERVNGESARMKNEELVKVSRMRITNDTKKLKDRFNHVIPHRTPLSLPLFLIKLLLNIPPPPPPGNIR